MTSAEVDAPTVIPSDPELVGLQEFFPAIGAPDFVTEAVADATGAALDPDRARLLHVRYHPTKDCVFLWSLDSGADQPVLVSGNLHPDGQRAKLADRATSARAHAPDGWPRLGSPRYVRVGDRGLFLQFFPYDVRMTGLTDAVSPSWATEAFARAGLSNSRETVREVAPVSYKPFRRCVLRYEGEDRPLFYGKVFRDQRGDPMAVTLQNFATALRDSGTPWDTAAPLAHFSAQQLLVSEAVNEGVELSALMRTASTSTTDRTTLSDCIGEIAEGLEPFGRSIVNDLEFVSPLSHIAELRRRMTGLADVVPALSDAISDRLERLSQEALDLPSERLGVTHRAFRHNHFIRRHGRLTLLDLDNLCLSGVSANAGIFLGYLDRTAAARPGLRPVVAECQDVFESTALAGGWIEPGWLAWYRTITRLKWALRAFFSLRPEWPEIVRELLTPEREDWPRSLKERQTVG